jgi:hypothetical protein
MNRYVVLTAALGLLVSGTALAEPSTYDAAGRIVSRAAPPAADAPRSRVRVASGDLNGDGAAASDPKFDAPRPAPQPLLVPAVQKPGVGSRKVAPRPSDNPPPPKPK